MITQAGQKIFVITADKRLYHELRLKAKTYSREEYLELIEFLAKCNFDIIINPREIVE